MEKKKTAIIILILLLAAVFISGCVGQAPTAIKSDAEVAQHVTNISKDVDNIASTLNDIDKKIG